MKRLVSLLGVLILGLTTATEAQVQREPRPGGQPPDLVLRTVLRVGATQSLEGFGAGIVQQILLASPPPTRATDTTFTVNVPILVRIIPPPTRPGVPPVPPGTDPRDLDVCWEMSVSVTAYAVCSGGVGVPDLVPLPECARLRALFEGGTSSTERFLILRRLLAAGCIDLSDVQLTIGRRPGAPSPR